MIAHRFRAVRALQILLSHHSPERSLLRKQAEVSGNDLLRNARCYVKIARGSGTPNILLLTLFTHVKLLFQNLRDVFILHGIRRSSPTVAQLRGVLEPIR